MSETIVITDTSVLINFLVLDKVALLTSLPERTFVVTEHIRDEVTTHYGEQLDRLEQAFAASQLEEITVTDLEEVELFAKLTSVGLGIGECSAIAVAANRHLTIAIDDKRAVKKIKKLGLTPSTINTEGLVVEMIRHDMLSIAEADQMKLEWETDHRFRLMFGSFSERV